MLIAKYGSVEIEEGLRIDLLIFPRRITVKSYYIFWHLRDGRDVAGRLISKKYPAPEKDPKEIVKTSEPFESRAASKKLLEEISDLTLVSKCSICNLPTRYKVFYGVEFEIPGGGISSEGPITFACLNHINGVIIKNAIDREIRWKVMEHANNFFFSRETVLGHVIYNPQLQQFVFPEVIPDAKKIAPQKAYIEFNGEKLVTYRADVQTLIFRNLKLHQLFQESFGDVPEKGFRAHTITQDPNWNWLVQIIPPTSQIKKVVYQEL